MAVVEVKGKGSKVEMAVGDEVLLRLSENGTTGYQWTVADLPAAVTVVADEFSGGGDAPGAAGERVFRFRAVEAGAGVVRASLARPWERDHPPQDQFEFSVEVR